MTVAQSPSIPLAEISLKKTQRGLITGGSGSGKSTLAEFLIQQFILENLKARTLVVDTKPRFLGEFQPNGLSASRLYKQWDHGAKLPNSMLLPSLGIRRGV